METRSDSTPSSPHANYTRLAAALAKIYPKDQMQLTKSALIVTIDDKQPTDYCKVFCTMTATVQRDSGKLTLKLTNPPLDDSLKKLVDLMDGQIEDRPGVMVLIVDISPYDPASVKTLAAVIRKLPKSRPRDPFSSGVYWDDNWVWIAKRTAKSLEKFSRCLRRPKSGS